MPEALARSHNDSILSRPARRSRPARNVVRAAVLWLLALPARSIAGAAFAAIFVGIVVNALALQKERHPAPFFPPKPVAQEQAQPADAPRAITPAIPDATAAAVEPPMRPAGLGVPADAASSAAARSNDPIRDLLRGEAGKDAHLVAAAQNALIKLGYAVKADGVAGASTLAAIHEFEHAHALAPSSEITPKLVKQLSAAASVAAQ